MHGRIRNVVADVGIAILIQSQGGAIPFSIYNLRLPSGIIFVSVLYTTGCPGAVVADVGLIFPIKCNRGVSCTYPPAIY
jgi:hypothetical protein